MMGSVSKLTDRVIEQARAKPARYELVERSGLALGSPLKGPSPSFGATGCPPGNGSGSPWVPTRRCRWPRRGCDWRRPRRFWQPEATQGRFAAGDGGRPRGSLPRASRGRDADPAGGGAADTARHPPGARAPEGHRGDAPGRGRPGARGGRSYPHGAGHLGGPCQPNLRHAPASFRQSGGMGLVRTLACRSGGQASAGTELVAGTERRRGGPTMEGAGPAS